MLPGGEDVLRYGGHRSRGRIHVVNVGDVVLIDVVDVGIVDDRGVGDVDVAGVGLAHVVTRHVDLARREREPADRDTDAHRDAAAGPANPSDQRRPVDGAHVARPRHPAPGAVPHDPAPVVKRRVAPGRIIHPGPAPGGDPCPLSKSVRRPPRHHHIRRPHVTVVGRRLPASVGVEIGRAGDVLGDVLTGGRLLPLPLSSCRPAVELIRGAERRARIAHCRGAGERDHLLGADGERLSAARRLRLPRAHLDDGRVAGVVDLDPIIARLLQRQRDIRRIDLVGLIGLDIAHVHEERAGGELHLRRAVIEIEERESGGGT